MNKHTERTAFQDLVGAASHDHAAALFCQRKNDISLGFIENVIHGNGVEVRGDLNIMISGKAPLMGLFFVYFCKLMKRNLFLFSCELDQFFVIKCIAELFCQRFSKYPASASVHAVDGNNTFTHMESSLLNTLFICFYHIIIIR